MSAFAIGWIIGVCITAQTTEQGGHDVRNPLYRELRTVGAPLSGTAPNLPRAVIPAPQMSDGLSAAAQIQVLESLPGRKHPVSELVRKSQVAPFEYRFTDPDALNTADGIPVHAVDLWFIAYGPLEALTDQAFLEDVFGTNTSPTPGVASDGVNLLDAQALARRRLTLRTFNPGEERLAYVVTPLLEKVRLSMMGHTVWTRTSESLLVAGRVDPRFQRDPEYPNIWQPLIREGNTLKAGPAQTYSGAIAYYKVTRLQQPAGALFLEGHMMIAEPRGWFNGANLLRSKIPLLLQSEVRLLRKKLTTAAGAGAPARPRP